VEEKYVTFAAKVRAQGKALVITIPKHLARELGVNVGDVVAVKLAKSKI